MTAGGYPQRIHGLGMIYLKVIIIGIEIAQGNERIRKHNKATNDNL